jgi:hypothetical protein
VVHKSESFAKQTQAPRDVVPQAPWGGTFHR